MSIYKTIIFSLLLIVISACGSSDTDSEEVNSTPEATDNNTSDNSDTAADDDSAEPEPEEELTLTCENGAGAGIVNSGSEATAVFKFNRTVNVSANVQTICGLTLLENENFSISNDSTGTYKYAPPASCAGTTLRIKLDTNGGLSAFCTWTVQ